MELFFQRWSERWSERWFSVGLIDRIGSQPILYVCTGINLGGCTSVQYEISFDFMPESLDSLLAVVKIYLVRHTIG